MQDPVAKKAQQARYYQKHHGAIRDRQKNLRLKSRYGITEHEYELMVVRQKGCCLICGARPTKLHVDHDHATGEVRGLLCPPCNKQLGYYEKPGWLERMHGYLAGSVG